MSLLVRGAIPGDADAACELGREVAAQPLLARYGVTPPGLGAELRRLALAQGPDLAPAASRLLLAEAGDGQRRLLGFARFSLEGSLGAGGYLQLIALVPGGEGRGAGAALLAAVEAEVRARSRYLFLLTSDFNHGAQRFYERHGYQQGGRLPDYAREGVVEILYWKRL